MVRAILPLVVRGATVRRKGRNIIGPIDLDLSGDGVTAVMGPNGAGKTTLLRMLHQLVRIREGTIEWNVPPEEARRRQAFVFQTPVMLRRSVRDNIAYPLALHGATRSEARSRAERWARRVGLGSVVGRQAAELSAGERQKLALVRALIREPDLLFLDEPTSNLDGLSTREIEALLGQARDRGVRMVMATHNFGQARRLASEVVFLHHGLVHEVTATERFLNCPATPEAAAFIRGDIVE